MKQFHILLLFVGCALGAWQDGVNILSSLRNDELEVLGSFEGHPEDHLTLLGINPESIFVGGRDALFNLSRDLKENSVLNWPSLSGDRDSCQIKGQKDGDCHNFIRVFHGPIAHHHKHVVGNHRVPGAPQAEALTSSSPSPTNFLVCGTNSYKPSCRYYDASLNTFSAEFKGQGISPFDPTHKSTSVLHHGAVYSGTVADFGGTDALIYKHPLRTEQNDLKHLNSPAFVSSASYGELAFFFFKEAAVEHANCGKAVFSRVGRLCRHDGGSKKHKDRFTTFLKARLNCSIPGEFPFYFDHIQGTTDIFKNGDKEMIYAVFTTAPNSISGSAVCAFTTAEILRAFEGPFKGQSSYDSNWLPVPNDQVPVPRPGQCSGDPAHVADINSAAFLKAHPLMDEAVEGTVVLTQTSNEDNFTAIAVDSSASISPYHILYIGTHGGKILKGVVNSSDATTLGRSFDPSEAVISQSWDVFPNEPIKSIRVLGSNRILVSTETRMKILSVDNCRKFSECDECIRIRDPHCAWDTRRKTCSAKNPERKDSKYLEDVELIQDVSAGDAALCPIDEKSNDVIEANHLKSIIEEEVREERREDLNCNCPDVPEIIGPLAGDLSYVGGSGKGEETILIATQNDTINPDNNEIHRVPHQPRPSSEGESSSFVRSENSSVSSQSVILATLSSAVLSLLIGFSLGFIASRWLSVRQSKTKEASNAAVSANESQRLTKPTPIDFVVNVTPSTLSKNPLKNNLNTDTLEKTVKKIYL